MDKYLRRSYQRMNQMSFGGQALAWFISIKLSDFVLKKFENIGAPFFNLILGFILSVLFLTVGMLLLDSIEKNKSALCPSSRLFQNIKTPLFLEVFLYFGKEIYGLMFSLTLSS